MKALTENLMTKIDVSVQQLETSIKLWADGSDVLSAFTLAYASLIIARDLSKITHPEQFQKFDNQFFSCAFEPIRDLGNFLKHADRDPDARITPPDVFFVEATIGLSISFLRTLNNDCLTYELTCFDLMMKLTWPEKFDISADPDFDIEEGAIFGAKLLKEDFSGRVISYRSLLSSETVKAGTDLRRDK